jgi:hypothetical protein
VVALRERGVGGRQRVLRFVADLALGEPFQELDHLAFRQRAHEAVGRLSVDERDHRRDRLDAHLLRHRRVVVDVHLDELDLALGRAHRLFQDRRELLAGSAPGRPEIDQHRLALRFLDHVLHEGLGGGFLDQSVGSRGGAGRDGDIHIGRVLKHVVLPVLLLL